MPEKKSFHSSTVFQALYDGEWKYVCWDDFWSGFAYEDLSKWCEYVNLNSGTTYTGTGNIYIPFICWILFYYLICYVNS